MQASRIQVSSRDHRENNMSDNEAARLLKMMPNFLNPRKAAGVSKTYAFRLSGAGGGEYSLIISDGQCRFAEQLMPDADVLIECSAQTWMDISLKRIKPWQAAMHKEFRFSGSLLDMLRFSRLFSGDSEATSVPEGLYAETENERNFSQGKWHKAERVLILQGSPQGKNGTTEIMVQHFRNGLARAGVTADVLYLRELDIKPCAGCFACWKNEATGECVINDDMRDLLARIPSYDLLVLATPLYVDIIPGPLKKLLDRTIPLAHPFIFNKQGRCRHPSRHSRMPDLALLAVCGFYEVDNFDILVKWLKAAGQNAHMPLRAALLRPHAHALKGKSRFAAIDQSLQAVEEAASQLVTSGKVSKKLLKAVSEPVMPKPMFLAAARNWWKEEY